MCVVHYIHLYNCWWFFCALDRIYSAMIRSSRSARPFMERCERPRLGIYNTLFHTCTKSFWRARVDHCRAAIVSVNGRKLYRSSCMQPNECRGKCTHNLIIMCLGVKIIENVYAFFPHVWWIELDGKKALVLFEHFTTQRKKYCTFHIRRQWQICAMTIISRVPTNKLIHIYSNICTNLPHFFPLFCVMTRYFNSIH